MILYNFCDFPAGTIPVTKQNAKDLETLDEFPTTEPFMKLIKDVSNSKYAMMNE